MSIDKELEEVESILEDLIKSKDIFNTKDLEASLLKTESTANKNESLILESLNRDRDSLEKKYLSLLIRNKQLKRQVKKQGGPLK